MTIKAAIKAANKSNLSTDQKNQLIAIVQQSERMGVKMTAKRRERIVGIYLTGSTD